jgi:hypothetical protein
MPDVRKESGARGAAPLTSDICSLTSDADICPLTSEAKRQSAIGLWLAGQERIAGTPVDHYLRGRGIDLSRLGRPPPAAEGGQPDQRGRAPRALRYHPELWADGRYWPAMLAIIRDGPTGQAIGCHRTFLARGPDGAWRKAPLGPEGAKRSYGQVKGGFIPLWRGRSGKPLRFAPAGDRVALTEGIEDGLTIALACPEYRVLAAISAGNFQAIALPEQVSTVLICADNDPLTLPGGKPHPARLAVQAAIARFQREGRRVLIARPDGAKDFNAVLTGGAA